LQQPPSMHGLIVNQLRLFVLEKSGKEGWEQLIEKSSVPGDIAAARLNEVYPDRDVVALVVALADTMGESLADTLRQFGQFLASGLLRVYQPLLRTDWKTLDIVQHTEEHIHTAVRLRDENAGPPYLRAERVGPDEVVITYTSERRLCALGEGIILGLAEQLGESVTVEQPRCMHRGDPECRIVVRRALPGADVASVGGDTAAS
jgi:predicted hydrocarbon binding protein